MARRGDAGHRGEEWETIAGSELSTRKPVDGVPPTSLIEGIYPVGISGNRGIDASGPDYPCDFCDGSMTNPVLFHGTSRPRS